MKRPREDQAEAPGQDSFLDVVANLVGILIILVMVVGAQAGRGLSAREATQHATPSPATDSAEATSSAEVARAEAAASSVEVSISELDARISRQNLEAAMREQERNKVQLLVTVAEQRHDKEPEIAGAAEREKRRGCAVDAQHFAQSRRRIQRVCDYAHAEERAGDPHRRVGCAANEADRACGERAHRDAAQQNLDDQRQTHSHFRCGDRDHEDSEDLAIEVLPVMRHRDEVDVHGVEDELDGHQDDDDVAAREHAIRV